MQSDFNFQSWSYRVFATTGLVTAVASLFFQPIAPYVLPAVLFVLSCLLLALDSERHSLLHVEKSILSIPRAKYLEQSPEVALTLQQMTRTADLFLYATGGKAYSSDYLSSISKQINDKGIAYHRLLSGDHITHELHMHLSPLLETPQVRASWTPTEKFGAFMLTEDAALLLLPHSRRDAFAGVLFATGSDVRHWERHFREAFVSSRTYPVSRTEHLVRLCEECGKAFSDTFRHSDALEQFFKGFNAAQ